MFVFNAFCLRALLRRLRRGHLVVIRAARLNGLSRVLRVSYYILVLRDRTKVLGYIKRDYRVVQLLQIVIISPRDRLLLAIKRNKTTVCRGR